MTAERVLFLSGLQVYPTISGGTLRSFALAGALRRHGFEVRVHSLTGRRVGEVVIATRGRCPDTQRPRGGVPDDALIESGAGWPQPQHSLDRPGREQIKTFDGRNRCPAIAVRLGRKTLADAPF